MIKILKKVVVAKNKWTSFVQEDFEVGKKKGSYLIVERPPCIMILPFIKIGGISYTYLVNQNRYPINKSVWQFPMGTLEKNVTPKRHAQNELEQETGLQSDLIKLVGKFYIDPGLSRQLCYVFIAQYIREGGKQKLEESEKGMKTKRFSFAELEKLVLDNKLIDGWIYSGLYFLKQHESL